MKVKAIQCKTALNKLREGRLPFLWDLNIYRGCGHGCKYCYALYSHQYLTDEDFYDTLYYKENVVEVLRKEISKPSWKKEVINFGGVTDSYQPLEKKMELMPELLKLMIEFKNPINISTKSDLILRDIDLIRELAEVASVNIAFTITCMDEDIRKVIEPGGSPSLRRFAALKELGTTNANRGVHLVPIIPYLTDTDENLEEIVRLAKEVKIDYILPGTLYLRGKTRKSFLDFYQKYDWQRCQDLKEVIFNKEKKYAYRKELYQRLYGYYRKYGIEIQRSNQSLDKKKDFKQMSLDIE